MSDNSTISNGDSIAADDISGVKYQRIKVVHGADGTSAGDVALGNGLPITLDATNFIFSSGNSTTTQLAVGSSFPGVIETALNQPAISIDVTSDQPLLLSIFQYIDLAGNFSVQPIQFYISANIGFSRSFTLNGNYVKVLGLNLGTATTTKLNINTAYGTIPAADGYGNDPVAIYGSGDFAGVSLFESVIKGELSLTTQTVNPELRDANGAQITSDAPVAQRLVAAVAGQVFTIDTQGYQSIGISMGTMAATITGANDLSAGTTPGAVAAYPVVLGTITSSLVAATSYLIPCVTRYIRITVTTAGWATYYQRAQGVPFAYASAAGVNIANIGGTASAGTAGMLAIGSSAATNGQTLGTVVTTATPAQTIVKATAGKLYFLHVGNPNTTAVYCKVFNVATATLGTTAATMNYYIPASSSITISITDTGLFFSTGICIAVTGGAPLIDNTAITTGCLLNYSFI